MTEQQAIEQLNNYRQKQARIQALGTYSVGGGIQISRLSEEDHLQQLHRRLRGMPTYMYLTKKEQALEATAHAYLTFYPAGVRAQRRSIPDIGAYQEDDKLLQELREKIAKVIDARAGCKYDLDEVLERLAELQDLRAEIKRVDDLLEALAKFKPELSLLLKLRYQDGLTTAQVAARLHISEATYRRRKRRAISEFLQIS
ncbi:sigma factor-like helix-turn-helix DNA-binding protein [Paenibacillus sp. FSL R7-0337]|uniref:sigma factor-like helix-turn-helix DNA-binding protein n=1 Tax=Paenibacillus sp. FSL R7-0337 TaxID=1926588 RepID=UPI00096F8B88|nr:sigma factor-like helix-turn-helix DNA-binding protein [Paenibacillus sp. FSL R7-0337]OMF98193.1 RNA polymerase subunit sigma-24 [Paenibacillus sp. FSL R7-0337]